MKKLMIATSVLFLSGFTTVTTADPSNVAVDFTCPIIAASGANALNNFNNYIGGYGSETINGNPSSPNVPFFVGEIASGANIPADLTTGSYANSGTGFDGGKGTVSCNYTSSASPAFDPITVSYVLTNAYGSKVISQTDTTISIGQYLGR
jgi:hypothetical protein